MSKRDWLWVLMGGLFFALINYPLLEIFNTDRLAAGLPPVVCYLFGIWLGAIGLLFFFVWRKPA
jgi:hypothetical protein